ncbi:MAG TPA: AAA family ATPase [Candidatus Polarisedimenticolia bacterium]|nr:AAA family ATPase [Candidatus Polarisedimenticolia bacterium]
MTPLFLLALGAGLLAATFLLVRRRGARPVTPDARPAPAAPPPLTGGEGRSLSIRLHEIADSLSKVFDDSALPADLVAHPSFEEGVRLFLDRGIGVDALLSYAAGENTVIACLAFEALRRRGETGASIDAVVEALGRTGGWRLSFALGYLAEAIPAGEPSLGRVFARAGEGWDDEKFAPQFLKEFLARRIAGGEPVTLGAHLQGLSRGSLKAVRRALKSAGPQARPLLEDYERFHEAWIDVDFLQNVGTVRRPGAPLHPAVIEHAALRAVVAQLEADLLAERPRSALLIGDAGVGKSAIARALAQRLGHAGWLVFEAGAAELQAGQMYIGQFEQRLRDILRHVSRPRRVLWVIPDLPALLVAGRHRYSEVGALDLILPAIEQGTITVLGECQPAAYEKLVLDKPRCAAAMTARRVEPTSDAETLRLALQWMQEVDPEGAASGGHDAISREAMHLALQYLGHKGSPGSVLDLLRITRERLDGAATAPGARPPMTTDDLIVTLSRMTGLPSRILDDRVALDLAALRTHFEERVKGQPEAIACLVDRVAMIKAGVTDPSRPSGVFLFAGPTGTGKTEIAKALAEFLFGSAERMIRLDMSELQTVDSLERILGTLDGEAGASLTDQLRRHPFSVVLLDEFEKAHERIWDLFLQVFDDGRLTDRRGRTADARHAIIILTSNLGGTIPSGLHLGFSRDAEGFRAGSVTRAIERSFRKEFLNRIDRVVVFRPLSREVMRQILRRELQVALQRRGLRSRAWEVEWDPSALEFLLEQGFTEDLGARPLKRAIERHLLAPLATTIVNRRVPQGDQFLFVTRRDNRLELEFIDPWAAAEPADAAVAPPPTPAKDTPAGAGPGLERLALQPTGRPEDLLFLRARLQALRERVEAPDWKAAQARALEETGRSDFWSSPNRFETLGQYEYRDRIESAIQGASSLLDRLARHPGRPGRRSPRELVAKLAHNLFLVETACADLDLARPREAFLLVEAKPPEGDGPVSEPFALELAAMYRAWAVKRRMRHEILEERSREGGPYRFLAAVSGFGSYSLLAAEDGIHLLEEPEERPKKFDRCRVQVSVLPQPAAPVASAARALLAQAEQTFRTRAAPNLRVVRRYRRGPSPLVRDIVRGYRTGRLDLVLGGDFDLIRGDPEVQPSDAD